MTNGHRGSSFPIGHWLLAIGYSPRHEPSPRKDHRLMAKDDVAVMVESRGKTFALPTLAFQGLPSTLCKGCGHNSITSYLIEACKSIGVNPYATVKMSGIGCSSKTPAYFLQASHGFNALHGRMPSVATGAMVANSKLLCIGISG